MRAWIKKHLPKAKEIQNLRLVRPIASWLKKRPYLWEFTKHTVAGSIAISFFIAFLPLPFEALLITILAIIIRVNLPIAFASIWLTNPFTLVPANYFSYKVGAWIIGNSNGYHEIKKFKFHWNNLALSWHEFSSFLGSLGKAYIIGLPIVSIGSALIVYAFIYLIWTLIEFFQKK